MHRCITIHMVIESENEIPFSRPLTNDLNDKAETRQTDVFKHPNVPIKSKDLMRNNGPGNETLFQ